MPFTSVATGGGRGWLGGVQGGCDYQFAGPLGNWVIGGFADVNWGFHQDDNPPHFTVDLSADGEKIDYTWAVGGRITGLYIGAHTYKGWFVGGGLE